ncbi:MAG: DUF2130 domain-containing protein [Verrucomicrobia bacterium]|nr:DUF2130 domain-containing protein [Verrucomicrobiota bacterium]
MKTLTCPNCGIEIPLEEAVTHRIREELQREFQADFAKREKAFAERELNLARTQAQLEKRSESLDAEIERRVLAQSNELLKQARREAETSLGFKLQEVNAQLNEKEKKLAEATKNELELRMKQRALESRQQALDLEVARRVDAGLEQVRDETRRTAAEEQRLHLSEKEKVINDLRREIVALKQKSEQGSQQLQGEVLELELESLLNQRFPTDAIVPVSKGVRGADLLQLVKTISGGECGAIIWETKRTRNWTQTWIPKLKDDQRTQAAEIALLVTEALPNGVRTFELIDGVWVTTPSCAMALATALRQGLISVANERLAADGKSGKMEQLYEYLAGTEFRQKIEAIVEAFVTMKADLESEKRAFAKIWARREKQIERVITNTALMYGNVQGIIGQSALPEIQCLTLNGLPASNDVLETTEE